MPSSAEATTSQDPLAVLRDRLNDPSLPVLRLSWPQEAELSGAGALQRFLPAEFERLDRAHALLDGLLRVPVIAVAGLINAGKSSLVASFLSAAGRPRVLRGLERRAGTHRFCLWAPAAWAGHAEFRPALERLLTEVFGEPPEPLHPTATEARAQQRRRKDLGRPLLAFDPGLDRHRLCLLDCPDVQRREDDEPAAQARLAALRAAGELCSGVLLVLPRSQIEVAQVGEVLDALPAATRIAAVNCVGQEDPSEIARETRAVLGDPDLPVYVAYDFHHRAYADRTPPWDPNLTLRDHDDPACLPCFFEAREEDPSHSPEALDPTRSLHRLADRFPPGRLVQRRQRTLLEELIRGVPAALAELGTAVNRENERAFSAARALREELAPLLGDNGQSRIKFDAALVGDLGDSLVRTAPWDVRPFLWASQRTRKAIRSLGRGLGGLGAIAGRLKRQVHDRLEHLHHEFEDGLLRETAVADRLRLWSAAGGAHQPRDFWRPHAAELLGRFRDQERSLLEPAEWDELTAALWRAVPKWKARVAVAGTLAAALAAVALLAFDGGASLVTLVGLKTVGGGTLAVTAKELLGALGFGVIAQGEASRRLQKRLEQRLAAQQRVNFLALAFDIVGLPRALLEGTLERGEPAPTVPSQPDPDGFATTTLRLCTGELLPNSLAALRRAARELSTLLP